MANLFPFLWVVESADLGDEFRNAIRKAMEVAGIPVLQGTAVHFEDILCRSKCFDHSVQATGEQIGSSGPWSRRKVPRLRSSQVEFTLQIGLCDFDVSHGHLGRGVAEQFHQRGETHARAQYFSGICMSPMPHEA